MTKMSKKFTILLAPDSFKESVSSIKICEYLKTGIISENDQIEVIMAPIADGGEGTVDALKSSPDARNIRNQVTGPLGKPVTTEWIMINSMTAVIEMASVAGLPLVPEDQRDPMKTTTYGLGELINIAIEEGAEEIIVGLGGSATNDSGAGMLQALGFSLLNQQGDPVTYGNTGLGSVYTINDSYVPSKVKLTEFMAASDVQNPLTGPNGASFVYGPQKGASPAQVEMMDENMKHFARLVHLWSGQDWSPHPGAGAAGGLGFAFLAFLNSSLQSGFEIVAKLTGLEEKICSADWVVTGEGKLDSQTLSGKGPYGVAQMAKKNKKPVIAIGGLIDLEAEKSLLETFDVVFKISPPGTSKKESMENVEKYLIETGQRIAKYITKSSD